MNPYRTAPPREPARRVESVRYLCAVDASPVTAWLSSLPLSAWPQQHRVDEQLRPAMVNDPDWYGFGARTLALVNALLEALPGTGPVEDYNRMLSCVMPGHAIPEHADAQEPAWLTRVHVPLVSNDRALFVSGGAELHLEVGAAYLVDTRVPHAIRNDGAMPRIHFMFDVRRR